MFIKVQSIAVHVIDVCRNLIITAYGSTTALEEKITKFFW